MRTCVHACICARTYLGCAHVCAVIVSVVVPHTWSNVYTGVSGVLSEERPGRTPSSAGKWSDTGSRRGYQLHKYLYTLLC